MKEISLRQLATQRGARMQLLREAMIRGESWDTFLQSHPEATTWFNEDGVPVSIDGNATLEEAIDKVGISAARLGETLEKYGQVSAKRRVYEDDEWKDWDVEKIKEWMKSLGA